MAYGSYLVAPDFFYKDLSDVVGGVNDIQLSYTHLLGTTQNLTFTMGGVLQMSLLPDGGNRILQRRKYYADLPSGVLYTGSISNNACAALFSGYTLAENASNPSFHSGRDLTLYFDYGNDDYIAITDGLGNVTEEYRNGASNVTVSKFNNQTAPSIFDYLSAGNFPTGISEESSTMLDPLMSKITTLVINPSGTANITTKFTLEDGTVIKDENGDDMLVGVIIEDLASPVVSSAFPGVVYTKQQTIMQAPMTIDGFWIPDSKITKTVTFHTADYAIYLQGKLSIGIYSNDIHNVVYKGSDLLVEPFITLATINDPDVHP